MPDLDILKQLIHPNAMVPLTVTYGKKSVELSEPQYPSSVVTVSNVPEDAIVIKVDSFKSPDAVFSNSKGECKRADYVIVSNANNKKRIIFIEIKATKDRENSIIKQLTGAKCFMLYCQAIGKEFWNQNDFLKDYKYRFVSIGHTSIAKRKTRIERKCSSIHDQPEKMLKIASPNHLQFNQLAGAA
ncbi:MAG: hypothetical protein WA056_00580 [Gallionella sp.]